MDGNGYVAIKPLRDRPRNCRVCHRPVWNAGVHEHCKRLEIVGDRVAVRRLTKAPRRKS